MINLDSPSNAQAQDFYDKKAEEQSENNPCPLDYEKRFLDYEREALPQED
jgi:hypothetical protein